MRDKTNEVRMENRDSPLRTGFIVIFIEINVSMKRSHILLKCLCGDIMRIRFKYFEEKL